MSRRYLSVQLPFFPVERHLIHEHRDHLSRTRPWWDEQAEAVKQNRDTGPLVLVEETARGTRLSALSQEAQALELWTDMKLSDARAMIPDLEVVPHNRQADETALLKLANWLHRYSPTIAVYNATTILLDTEGCDHLFSGEEMMLLDIHQCLSKMGLTCRLGLANTIGAAIALTTHSTLDIHCLPKTHDKQIFDEFPIEALRIDADTALILKRLGLKQIGHLRHIPRAALENRFGKHRISKSKSTAAVQSLSMRLDQLFGDIREPLNPLKPQSEFAARLPCIEPALEIEGVEAALAKLLVEICSQLERQSAGARGFRFCGYRVDGNAFSKQVFLSRPLRDNKTLKRLFKPHIESVDCGFGVDLFTLEARFTETVTPKQNAAFEKQNISNNTDGILDFADTLANRLERPTALRLKPNQSHVPERAQSFVSAGQKSDWEKYVSARPIQAPRPIRLFERPEPAQVTAELPDSPPAQFVWRKRLRRVIRSRGPERILPEWWKDDFKPKTSALLRDYYDVEDEHGQRYWIYRTVRDHPIIEETDEDAATESLSITSWYVHGLF